MVSIIDALTQVEVVPVAPITSKAGGEVMTSTTRTTEQPIVAVRPVVMPDMSSNEQKMMDRLHHPHFHSDALEDGKDYLDKCHEMLRTLGLVESNGVDFTIFQLRGAAKIWWQAYELGVVVSPPFSSAQFSQLILERYIPYTRGVS